MANDSHLDTPITRREALRRTVVFSAAAALAGGVRPTFAEAATEFADDGMHVFALGDYGAKGSAGQRAVADAMAAHARSLSKPVEAVLALGDNFYNQITPERFIDHFEKMYSDVDLACPFYACPGNHDYGTAKYDFQEGKLQMQLDYAAEHADSRFKMPSKWYTIELPSPEAPLVKAIVLDGNYWEAGLTPKEKVEQQRFLDAELKKPTKAPWLWFVNHFPLFSDTTDRGDSPQLIRAFGERIKNSPVSLCFAGHDHNMQHLQVEGYPQNFMISGAGGAGLYDITPTGRGFTSNQRHGFTHVHVTRDKLDVQFLNADRECIHRFERDPDGKTTVTV
jgi:tartrate-resistant acid phosphatase type 5